MATNRNAFDNYPTQADHLNVAVSKQVARPIPIIFQPKLNEGIFRAFDIVAALVAIAVFLIPILLISLLIKIDSKGSVIFKQKRIGRGGQPFLMFKFRSMVQGAEIFKDELNHLNIMSGPFFKVPSDPRITRFGRYLRRSSLDELPQFFNVLLGNMSLVGPRPMLPSEFDTLKCYDIVRIKPGITGLWQVAGRNEVTDCYEKLRLDREYLRRRSIGLNLKIILKTFGAVLSARGAS